MITRIAGQVNQELPPRNSFLQVLFTKIIIILFFFFNYEVKFHKVTIFFFFLQGIKFKLDKIICLDKQSCSL